MEAIQTNVLGAENVLNEAYEFNVKNAVFLSTDKAVYPINAMGLSKAMMEKLVAAKSRNLELDNKFCITRYGNVMASRGSVIPLFISQIKSGEPLTITEPDMTRFMMNLEESVELVEFAFKNAEPGDIFVRKASACSVINLAEALLDIFNSKSKIKVIGTRHGEKKFETLLTREEMERAQEIDNFFRIPADSRDLNYSEYYTEGKNIHSDDDYTSHNTKQLDKDEMKKILLNLEFIQKELEAE